MVKSKTVGVLGLQGAITEHIYALKNVVKKFEDVDTKICVVKDKTYIKKIDALIIPGGESSTISNILNKTKIYDSIIERIIDDDIYIMGTCAGCVLLAKEIDGDNDNDVKLLNAIDMKVQRNAFGRQKESFEQNINIKGFNSPFNAVFIRAPVIKKIWGNCENIAKINEKIVAVRQKKFLALSFHPELSQDDKIHQYFLKMIV
jgi:5'-phosphate synthase pdxT subunit